MNEENVVVDLDTGEVMEDVATGVDWKEIGKVAGVAVGITAAALIAREVYIRYQVEKLKVEESKEDEEAEE